MKRTNDALTNFRSGLFVVLSLCRKSKLRNLFKILLITTSLAANVWFTYRELNKASVNFRKQPKKRLCVPSEVDLNWKHTASEECSQYCDRKIGKNGRHFLFNNSQTTDENGKREIISTLKRRKGTRWGTDQVVIDFLAEEKNQGRGGGNILGISGTNFFDLFDEKLSTFTTADYPSISCEDMPYDEGLFDYVVCNQVLEHVSKPWLCVEEFHRVLKKNGHVIIVIPSIYQEHRWPKDNWRVLSDGMHVLLSSFSGVDVGTFGDSTLLKHMIDNPKDRYSQEIMKLAVAAYKRNQRKQENLYYTSVYGIGRK